MFELIPSSPTELEPYAPSLILLGFYLGIAPLLPLRRTWARALVMGIAVATAVRYLVWRLFETLEPQDPISLEAAWYLGVYAFEILTFLNYSVLFLTLARWADRSAEADRLETELRRLPPERLPSVDVFIPTYNEGPDVLERSILAALRLDYPDFLVWVLDDGRRDWLAEFCAAHGARYVRRPDRSHAKAGNVNYGLSVSRGELFAIFDADFAPRRDFLYRTVGFFSDPRIGIVQTPQHFFNRDPIQMNLGLAESIPDEQRLFFDVIAPCRDAWDAAFCCGSCSIQRRAAIEAAGGVPTESITEDILSTLVLLRGGFITRYLNERLSMGLAAESLNGYFTQRGRWCRGAIQTLFLRSGPLGPGLTPLQRLFFLPIDWLVQYAARLLVIVVPIVFLWTGVGPFAIASADDLISHQLPPIVALGSVFLLLAPHRYIPVLSSAIAMFTALRIAPTALGSLIKPFGVPFRVTPKGRNNEAAGMDRTLLGAILILAALTVGGLVINRIEPDRAGLTPSARLVAEGYALYSLVLLAITAVLTVECPRPRRGERFAIERAASCRRRGGPDLRCRLLDVSESGALLKGLGHLPPGDRIELAVDGLGTLAARVVRHRGGQTAVEFRGSDPAQRAGLVDLIYASGLSNEVGPTRKREVVKRFFSHLFRR